LARKRDVSPVLHQFPELAYPLDHPSLCFRELSGVMLAPQVSQISLKRLDVLTTLIEIVRWYRSFGIV